MANTGHHLRDVGGITLFGMVGLFIGPVVLGGTKVLLDQCAKARAASRPG